MGFLDEILARRKAAVNPPEPKGKNHLVVVVLDSCRFDSFASACPRTMLRLGELEKRYSYASWTAPSHYNLLMGLMPHRSPTHVFASDYYKQDYLRYNERLGAEGIEFEKLIPHLYLPTFLRREMGYRTHARVSLPVLNPATPLNRDFDSFQLMDRHNDLSAMLDTLEFEDERPSFHLLNVGETHYPYATPDEDPEDWPRLHGLHGTMREVRPEAQEGRLIHAQQAPEFFDSGQLEKLRARQIHTVQYLDGVMQKLFDLVPKNTWIILTSDHGELFGEGGYFGHGPILHDKVLEVPFLEGKIR